MCGLCGGYACVSTGAFRIHKRVSDPLELDLQAIVNRWISTVRSSARAICTALNHGAASPVTHPPKKILTALSFSLTQSSKV